jgi:hypothetical protein
MANMRGLIPMDWVADSPATLCIVSAAPCSVTHDRQPASPGTFSDAILTPPSSSES